MDKENEFFKKWIIVGIEIGAIDQGKINGVFRHLSDSYLSRNGNEAISVEPWPKP